MEFKFYSLKLAGICTVVFILQQLISGFTEVFILNQSAWSEPWRFLTAIFLHGGAGHILYNMFALALFGSLLEKFAGGKNFLLIFFISGLVGNLVSVNFYDSSLGASGAIYGIFGVLMVIKPTMMVWALGFPMPMFIAGLVWIGGDLVGLFTPSNVGHIAHLSGAVVGLIAGIVLRRGYKLLQSNENQVVLNERDIQSWEDRYLR